MSDRQTIIQLVQIDPAKLQEMLDTAVARGVELGVLQAKTLLGKEQQVSQNEFKKLSGYKDEGSFRAFLKTNRIMPVEVRAGRNYYLPSQLAGLQKTKGVHLAKA